MALKNKEFTIYVQPQISSSDETIVGGEVLVRWIKPDGTIVPPNTFIPVLEKNGLIFQLDYFVWNETCLFIKHLRDLGLETSLSVNLSPQDFYHCDIYTTFTDLIEEHQIPASSLKIEITETAVISDIEKQVDLIKKLQQSGFIVEMDDFGSGYSSLNTLKDIPINILKMDMRFFEQSHNDAKSRKIIKAVTILARMLNLPIIAEGVENQAQVDYLTSLECMYIQGYFYAKPMSMNDFIIFRANHHYVDVCHNSLLQIS